MAFGRSKREATGTAELLSDMATKWLADRAGSPGGSTSSASRHTVWRVRLVPDDGQSEFESRLSIWGRETSGGLERGMKYYPWTYVRYDPSAPDECELDTDRLEKEFGRAFKGHERVTMPATIGAC